MAKLNQIIAIEKGIKSKEHSDNTELYKLVQKKELFEGLDRTYQPLADEGQKLPAEHKRVQQTTGDALRSYARGATGLMTVTARKDWTNCVARADVKIDGVVIVAGAPVSYLLFLEKQLSNMRAFVDHLPTLGDADVWAKDPNSGNWRSETATTHRTEKKVRPVVAYEATKEHPAQVHMITEDVIVGHWSITKQSGAMQATDKMAMLERLDKLARAVKIAREEANMQDEAKTEKIADAVFTFVLNEKQGE